MKGPNANVAQVGRGAIGEVYSPCLLANVWEPATASTPGELGKSLKTTLKRNDDDDAEEKPRQEHRSFRTWREWSWMRACCRRVSCTAEGHQVGLQAHAIK